MLRSLEETENALTAYGREQECREDDLVQSDTAVVTNLVALYKALGGGWNGR